MTRYFGGGAEELSTWRWGHGSSWAWTDAPFCYRLLFHGAVDGLARLFALGLDRPHAYWTALLIAITASVVFAAFALDALLKALHCDARQRVMGQLAWAALPAINLAFAYPVQTKEDFLGYGVFFFGLRAVLNRDLRAAIVWSVVGALTRETMVLISLLYFVAGPTEPLVRRTLPMAAAGAIYLGLRLVLGIHSQDAIKLGWNLARPVVLIVSLLMVLGYGWRFVARGPEQKFVRLFPWALVPLLVLHLVFGLVLEFRISLLLAPWAIYGLVSSELKPHFLRAACLAGIIALAEIVGAGHWVRKATALPLDQFAKPIWWGETYLQLGILALLA